MATYRERVQELTRLLEDADPVLAKSPEVVQVVSFIKKATSRPQTATELLDPCDKFTYADIAAGRVSPSPFSDASDKKTEAPTQLLVVKPIPSKSQAPKHFEEDKREKEVVTKQIPDLTSGVQKIQVPEKVPGEKKFASEANENLIAPKTLRRGRSPNRRETPKSNQHEGSKLPPKPKPRSMESRNPMTSKAADDVEIIKSEIHAKTVAKRLLAPESIRGRSPSPLYIAGESASYAQMVKSGSRPESRSGTPDRVKEQMVPLKITEPTLSKHKPENKAEEINKKNIEPPVSTQKIVEEPKVNKDTFSENFQNPIEKGKESDAKINVPNTAKSQLDQKESLAYKASLKTSKASGTSLLPEKKGETSNPSKDTKQKHLTKSRTDKKQSAQTSTSVKHNAPPIVPLQQDIHIPDFQTLTPDLQYSGAFTDPQAGLHYPPGLFQPYIGPEGEVASFIASGQQLISSGLGTYTTSEPYCNQPLFVEDSFGVNTGMYGIQQTPDYQSQVFVSNAQGYIPSFGASHTAYTHLESDQLALRADNDSVSYASILAQGLTEDPHLNQSRLLLQTEAQQWGIPPTCDIGMITNSVGSEQISSQEENKSLKGMKYSERTPIQGEVVDKPDIHMEPKDKIVLEKVEEKDNNQTGSLGTKPDNIKHLDKNSDSHQKKTQQTKGSTKPDKSLEQGKKSKELNVPAPNQKQKKSMLSDKSKKQVNEKTELASERTLSNPVEEIIEQSSTKSFTDDKKISRKDDPLVENRDEFQKNKKGKKKSKHTSQAENNASELNAATIEDLPTKVAELGKSENDDPTKNVTEQDKDLDHKTDTKTAKSKKKQKQVTTPQNNSSEIEGKGDGGLKIVDIEEAVDSKENIAKSPSKKNKSQNNLENHQKEQDKGKSKQKVVDNKNPSGIKNSKAEESLKAEKGVGSQEASAGDEAVKTNSSSNEVMKLNDQSSKNKKKKPGETPKSTQTNITESRDKSKAEIKPDNLDSQEKMGAGKGKPLTDKPNKKLQNSQGQDQSHTKSNLVMDDGSTKKPVEEVTTATKSKDSKTDKLNIKDDIPQETINKDFAVGTDCNPPEINKIVDQSSKRKKKKSADKPKNSQSDVTVGEQPISSTSDKKEIEKVQAEVKVESIDNVKKVNQEMSSLSKKKSVKSKPTKNDQFEQESIQKEQKNDKSKLKSDDKSSNLTVNPTASSENTKNGELKKIEEDIVLKGTLKEIATTQNDSNIPEEGKPGDLASKKKKRKGGNKPTNLEKSIPDETESIPVTADQTVNKGIQSEAVSLEAERVIGTKPLEQQDLSEKNSQNIKTSLKSSLDKETSTDQRSVKERKGKGKNKDKSKLDKDESTNNAFVNEITLSKDAKVEQTSKPSNEQKERFEEKVTAIKEPDVISHENVTSQSNKKKKNNKTGGMPQNLKNKTPEDKEVISCISEQKDNIHAGSSECDIPQNEPIVKSIEIDQISAANVSIKKSENVKENIILDITDIPQQNIQSELPKKDIAPQSEGVSTTDINVTEQHITTDGPETKTTHEAKSEDGSETCINVSDEGPSLSLVGNAIQTTTLDKNTSILSPIEIPSDSYETKPNNNLEMTTKPSKSKKKSKKQSNIETKVNTLEGTPILLSENKPSENLSNTLGASHKETDSSSVTLVKDKRSDPSVKIIPSSANESLYEKLSKGSSEGIQEDEGQSFNNIMVDIISKLDEAILKADAETKEAESSKSLSEKRKFEIPANEKESSLPQTNVLETAEGFKSEIKFNIENCSTVDSSKSEKSTNKSESKVEPIEHSPPFKPLSRRNTKKSKQLTGKQLQNNNMKTSEGDGKEGEVIKPKVNLDFSGHLDDEFTNLLEKQDKKSKNIACESIETTEKEVKADALKELTPEAQELVELETVNITKLPVTEFKNDNELLNDLAKASGNVVVGTPIDEQVPSKSNGAIKDAIITPVSKNLQTKTHSVEDTSAKSTTTLSTDKMISPTDKSNPKKEHSSKKKESKGKSHKKEITINEAKETSLESELPKNTSPTASDSPNIIEIELNESTVLNDLTEDVIKPFLKRSSPNIFTFDNTAPSKDIVKTDQKTNSDKEVSKSVINKDQNSASIQLGTTDKIQGGASTEDLKQRDQKSKTTSVEDSATINNTESSQTKDKIKKPQSKSNKQNSGKPALDKTGCPREEEKPKTSETEVLSLEVDGSLVSTDKIQGGASTEDLKQRDQKSKTTSVEDSATINNTESSQTKDKIKKPQSKSNKQISGKPALDKTGCPREEEKPKTSETEVLSLEVDMDQKTKTKSNLPSDQNPALRTLKREKSPLLALAPPWMAKLVQGESTDNNKKPEEVKKCASSDVSPLEREAEIVSGAIEVGIFGSVKERPKPMTTTTEEVKTKPEASKKKQKKKGNAEIKKGLEEKQSSIVSTEEEPVDKSKKQVSPTANVIEKEKTIPLSKDETQPKVSNKSVKSKSDKNTQLAQNINDEKEPLPKEKQCTENESITESKHEGAKMQQQTKIHEMKLPKGKLEDVTNENSNTTLGEDTTPENKIEIKSKKKTEKGNKKNNQIKLKESTLPEKVTLSDPTIDNSKPNIIEGTVDVSIPIKSSLVKDTKTANKLNEKLESAGRIEEKDQTSEMQETTVQNTSIQLKETNNIKTDINEMKASLGVETFNSDNINSQQKKDDISDTNAKVIEETVTKKKPSSSVHESFSEKVEASNITGNNSEGKGSMQPKEQSQTSPVISLDKHIFSSPPKYSHHELEDAENKLCEVKNESKNVLNKTEDDVITLSQTKPKEIISWANIAAKDKVIKEEIKEVATLELDSSPKPVPIVICVDESDNQSSAVEPINVDPEGFMEFVPKKEIRKRKSRSRSRSRTQPEPEKVNVKDDNVYATERTAGETISTFNDKNVSDKNYNVSQINSEGKKEVVSSQLIETQILVSEPDIVLKTTSNVQIPTKNSGQLLNVANKSSRSRSRSHSQSRGRSRSRSRKVSETEKEVDDILRAWSREEVLQQNIFLDNTFWGDKWKYDDAEKQFHELFNKSSEESLLTIDTDEKHGDDDNDKDPSSGPSSPEPRKFDGKGDRDNAIGTVTETLTADLPHGVGAWSDSSTYISDEKPSNQPSDNKISMTTPLKSSVEVNNQVNKTNPATPTVIENKVVGFGVCSDLSSNVLGYHRPPEDNVSAKIPLTCEGMGDQSKNIDLVTEGMPHGDGSRSASSTFVLDDKSSSRPSAENRPPETLLITTSQFTKLSKVTLASDLESLRRDLAVTEEQLRALPTEGVEEMLDALVKCGGDLKTHELTAGCIREGVLVLPQDEETEALQAEVAAVRERITALEQQVEAGKKKLQACHDTKEKLHREVGEYRNLMEELEKWVKGIKLMLKTDLHKDNAEEQIAVHKNLLDDLAQRQKKLSELRSSCSNLETFEDVKDLAMELNSSLTLLDDELSSAKNLTEDRLKTLQDLLNVEPELPAPVLTPSPVAATYPVLSPVESPVHEASRDDTIASNVSPIPDEEITIPVPQVTEIPKPELIAQDSGTQTGKSLTLSPEKQIHMEVQTDSPTERPAAVAIQTDNGGWEPKVMPKGKIQILQRVDGNEETIEIATKSNVESHPETTRPGEDLSVEIRYKENKEGHEPQVSELNISHFEPQSFETIVMDPGESSTEVIVDADGTKRIVLRKTRKVISHRTMTSGVNMETVDMKPIAFSQVTLQQQQTSVTHTMPDGKSEVTTSQGYMGQIASGTQDGTITTAEFSNMPHQVATYQALPSDVDVQNIPQALDSSQLDIAEPAGFTEWTTGSSTVRAVVHQVRRRIIRRTRRIIRKVVIIDGKEHVTEEVVEEPEEVEVSEDGIPRISFEISKEGQGGMTVQEPFEEDHSLQDAGVEISEILPGDYYDDKLEGKETSPTTVSPPSESYKPDEHPNEARQEGSPKKKKKGKYSPDTNSASVSNKKDRKIKQGESIPSKQKDDLPAENINQVDKNVNILFIESEKSVVEPKTTISLSGQKIHPVKEESPVKIEDKKLKDTVTKKSDSSDSIPKESPENLSKPEKDLTYDMSADKKLKKGKKTPDKSPPKKSKQKSKEKTPSSPLEMTTSDAEPVPKETLKQPIKDENTVPALDTTTALSSNVKEEDSPESFKADIEDETKTQTLKRSSISKSPIPIGDTLFTQALACSPEQAASSPSEDNNSERSKSSRKSKNKKKSQEIKSGHDPKSPAQSKEINLTEMSAGEEKLEANYAVIGPSKPILDENVPETILVTEESQINEKEPENHTPKPIESKETFQLATESSIVKDKVSRDSIIAESSKDVNSDMSDDESKSTIPVAESKENNFIDEFPSVHVNEDKLVQEISQPTNKSLGNIEIEITVQETKSDSLKDSIPKVVSDTKIEPKMIHDVKKDTMEIVKQKSDVVLPGVVQVTREVIKKSESPSSSSSGKRKNKSKILSPEELSTPTSLAESMEIELPESQNSSDTTKPTHQEVFEMSSPRSDISQLEESVKTYDTGYEGEDKTTVDESSMKDDDDTSKSKKKKKKRQKLKEIIFDDHSSIEPKSSDFVPSDVTEEVDDNIKKDIIAKKSKSKKPGKKTKNDKTKEEMHVAQSAEEEIAEGSIKDLSEHSESDGIVKIVQESMPTGSSSEAEEFKSTQVLSSVPVLEVLPTQSESIQTITPEPDHVKPIDTVEMSTQITQSTQEMFAQTSTPEQSSIEACIQTIPGELVPTAEESAQTLTPKAQSPVETADSIMQTAEEVKPIQQEEEIQTDEVKFGSLDNVDISMQTVPEETRSYQEETAQTSPEPEKIQSSSQVVSSDLIPTEEGGSQTVDQSVTTVDLSTQIQSSELIPTHDESIQTTFEENIPSNITQLADKQEDKPPEIPQSQDTVATDSELVPEKPDTVLTQPETIKTSDSTSQTKPVKFRRDSGSDETNPSTAPFKIEIEATVTYGQEYDTDISTSDLSKSDVGNQPAKEICAPPSESTDSDVSSWASHKMRPSSPQNKKGKKSKSKKQKISEQEIVPAADLSKMSPQPETVDKEESSLKPDIKAKITFDVDEYDSSLKPELVAEISQHKNKSGIFIQAELNPELKSQSKEKLPGFSQTVELEMSSGKGNSGSEPTRPSKKSKKDRKIRQRAETKALPEASLVLSHEELRGEHSPGPPERVKYVVDHIKSKEQSQISLTDEKATPSKIVSIQSTLSTPCETKYLEFSSPGSTVDVQFTIHERPDKLTLEEKSITNESGSLRALELESKYVSPQIQSPDDYKTDSQIFIDYESTGDSSQSEIPRDPDIQYAEKKKSKQSESEDKQWQDSEIKPKKSSEKIRIVEAKDPVAVDNELKKVGEIISNRVKQAQHPPNATSILFLTTFEQEEPSTEERANQLDDSLESLQQAVKKQDVVIIQQTIIVTVETISTWLETIEYKIQNTKQSSSHGTVPEQRLDQLSHLQDEISRVESGVATLGDIITQSDVFGQENIRRVIDSLQQQVATVEETAKTTRDIADKDLARWEEFLNAVNNVSVLVEQLRTELEELVEDHNTPALIKLQKLEALEGTNHSHKTKCGELLTTAHGLLRDFPGRVIPLETYTTQDTTQAIQHNINAEREKLLQLVSLAEEYEQTLKDFAQITDVAEALVDGPVVVSDLQHLQEEMQKHRKFFVNLSHCRGILESLEGHLDSETRTKHSALHDELHRRASMILDKAAGRAQQMALAASRWTVLEQGMKEERGWLQVANQRVPDLSTVTTSDYNQYISLYQSLSSDIALHAVRAGQLVCVAHGLQGLVQSESCAIYDDHYAAILALQAEVNTELGRLLAFRDSWTDYLQLSDKLDAWMRSVPADTTPPNMRQFWELKAQFELHKHLKEEAAAHLDTAFRVIPVADETAQRQLQTMLLDRWKSLEARLDSMQTTALESLSTTGDSVEDKLGRLERELTELATLLADMHGVIRTEEELRLYIERLQVMRGSVDHIMEQLSRLGLLSTAQSDRVSSLLNGARATEMSLREELEMATLLRDRLATLRRGVAHTRRDQQRAASVLDQCEASVCENQDTVQQALENCQGVEETLATQWGELMSLRQLLHTLPSRLRLSMSPVKVERELAQLQDDHSELTARCRSLYGSLAQRLALWRRFYSQLEMVQQSVKETDYMMEILAVQGRVDYERLVKATERLEGLSESLGEREVQLDSLRSAAEPLRSSCTPEVAKEIDAAVTEVVAAWEDTVTSLQGLCTRYQHAVQLWKQYREASQAIARWADTAAEAVDTAEPRQAVQHVQVCEEKLASQQARLSELRDLVAQIAADVGLEPEALLGGEVAALGAKLEDVRETLAALVEAAEDKVERQERCADDLREAKDFLATVQKSLQAVDSSGGEGALEQLTALRNHLVALGKTDGQIQALRDKTADLPPAQQDVSVMDILQLWQQVFRETFQQYHRLSGRLVRDQEGLEALRLWEEYLLHVQTFLTSAVPDDYNALSEHRNLCQVHQNLLSSQQTLLLNKPERSLELSVTEQFNSLTNLHNETLARIMEREAQVRNRMNIWDQYRNDHKTLLAWLGDTEKEKNRLRLRYVHMRVIPKTIQRIQVMLDKLPEGEERAQRLGGLLQQLCQFCDETLATSLRLEHSAVVDKINSMRAALHTWLDFLVGLRELTERYEKEVEAVQRTFSDIHVALDEGAVEGAACVPASHHGLQRRLDVLKAARERVSAVSTDLNMLGVTQEQLKDSLNPVDIKTVSQRVWLLQQQQEELEHQLDMAIYQLEDRLRQGDMFDKRAERFLVWASGVDRRLEGLSSGGCGEPADQLRRLETELEAEVGLRRREADWLRDCGTELVEAEGVDATPRRAHLSSRLSTINTAWERVQQLTSGRANKLRQIIEGMSTLEQRIEELRGWLHSIELQLATPIVLEHCTQAGLDKCMAHHDALTKDIEQHSGTVADVLNHCELLLHDCDSANVQLNTDGISTSMQLLERRWKNVCVLVTERKAKLLRTWQLLQEVLRLCAAQSAWLRAQTEALDRLTTQTDAAQIQALPTLIADVEKVLTEVECQRPALELLQSSYTALATQSSLDSLTADARSCIAEWSALRSRAEHLLTRLRAAQDRWLRFTEAHGAAVLALTNVDVQLTQIDLLETSEDADLESYKTKLKKLMLLKKELESHGELLKRADQLGLEVMNSCLPHDVPSTQLMVDEYQLLWKDIMERMKKLMEACREECRKRNVVNEEVQVETLRFETDSSVQVNTLPAPVLRRDAYVYELQTAVNECNANLDQMAKLEKLSTQNAAKCVAACQSSVDLVRHLSSLLVEQCGASEEQACSRQVEQLERRYQQLMAQKQAEDRERRELSESGRFTCPLCTRRNWKQLDNDLWRLQKWLEFAEATQASQTSPPSNINQLEEVIQDQREFLLDLDSHKSLVVSLNTVGRHLAEHTEDEARAHDMTQRLADTNRRWDDVCAAAARWETRLQTALLQNPEFHETIDELVHWLEQTEAAIQKMEPVDVAEGREVIESKYNKFKDLRHDLEVCEPRVMSLQEAACHLLRHRGGDGGEATATDACERLTHLRLRLQSLTRLTGSYLLKLGTVLGKDPVAHASLAALSHELLDQAAGGASSVRSSTDQLHSNAEGIVDTSVLARGYRFLGRVVRASLPIQALMLVMLGVASLVPITEEDFSCSITRAFGPTLRYVNGPPPM